VFLQLDVGQAGDRGFEEFRGVVVAGRTDSAAFVTRNLREIAFERGGVNLRMREAA
jgi:hypothetical protein